ncbi:MAG: hypothetical protein JNM20_15290 [Rhizobiales bacterium]|nr:hypothetical protein [Hyphomicrobiales bacterium]
MLLATSKGAVALHGKNTDPQLQRIFTLSRANDPPSIKANTSGIASTSKLVSRERASFDTLTTAPRPQPGQQTPSV